MSFTIFSWVTIGALAVLFMQLKQLLDVVQDNQALQASMIKRIGSVEGELEKIVDSISVVSIHILKLEEALEEAKYQAGDTNGRAEDLERKLDRLVDAFDRMDVEVTEMSIQITALASKA